MDHLDHMSGSIGGHQDISKGTLRSTMQSGDNGSLSFITGSGMSHSGREQEYIESTLLSTDLLSSHLPANFLNDYINSVSSSAPNSIGGMQSALMEHHYRSFTSDELHTLSNDSNNESNVIGNESKDIPGFSTLSSYDKILNVGQSTSPINNGLAQIAGTIDAFVHFPLPGAGLHSSGAGNDGFDVVTNTLVSAHPHTQLGQQHYSLPHASNTPHLQQHQAQGQMHHHQNLVEMTTTGSQQLTSLGQTETATSLSSLLPPVDVSIKPFCNNNSIIPISSTAPCRTDVPNSSTTITTTAIKLSDSPNRYYSCNTLPSLISHNQRTSFSISGSLVSAKNIAPTVVECETRTQTEEEMSHCIASMENTSCALLGNINLPHKKRLAKKLGDTKEGVCNSTVEVDHALMVGNMHLSQRISNTAVVQNISVHRSNSSDQIQPAAHQHSNGSVKTNVINSNNIQQKLLQPSLATFSCQLCGKQVQDQLLFFTHLKEHYEPTNAGNNSSTDGVNISASMMKSVVISSTNNTSHCDKLNNFVDCKKTKPKLPRVKHTKKLKNDRTLKQTNAEPENIPTQKNDSKLIPIATNPPTPDKNTVDVLLQKAELNDAMIAIECSLNGGEFSETEDMLEGIRTVVQKVQETVDTDTTEELCMANSRPWFPSANEDNNGKVISDNITSNLTSVQQTEKGSLDLSADVLDTHGIHIQSASENFLLLLDKTQFNDGVKEEDVESSSNGATNSQLNKYLCSKANCGRRFKSKTAFSYHQLQHTGERPYKCKSCEKCFFTCSALKVHERLHSGEKPYKCEECGHDFRQWGDLKYHKISKHSNEKSHKCEFCGKEFARRYSLVLHRRIHTNEKNYVCDYCNKGFRASTYLQAHRMVHTGEKPHQCTLCDKKFRCHGDLNRHQKTHTRFCVKSGESESARKLDEEAMLVQPSETVPKKSVKSKSNRKSIASKNNNNVVTV
uniref:C2H2-type domain-containing protein n=1 Tax=Anopheles farauti TaxID=69004 RepID=A0A182QYF2_9DIPT